jgi:hypothetical protein
MQRQATGSRSAPFSAAGCSLNRRQYACPVPPCIAAHAARLSAAGASRKGDGCLARRCARICVHGGRHGSAARRAARRCRAEGGSIELCARHDGVRSTTRTPRLHAPPPLACCQRTGTQLGSGPWLCWPSPQNSQMHTWCGPAARPAAAGPDAVRVCSCVGGGHGRLAGHALARACVCACMRAGVRARVRACVLRPCCCQPTHSSTQRPSP